MLTVHINEVQCALSIHAYSVCWSNLNPVFSTPAHLPQSLFYCQASFGSLRGHVRSHPPGSDLAHFLPCLDPSILLYAIWFCASWRLNNTASCPQSHFSIHSPSAGHLCWRGSQPLWTWLWYRDVQVSVPLAFSPLALLCFCCLMEEWAKENLGKCNWALEKSNSKNWSVELSTFPWDLLGRKPA